jgi:hypothetical protein
VRRLLLDLRRRAQTNILKRLRRSRLFPRTLVDRQGDDERLGDARTDAPVMVYFPGALDTLYQITPWLPTFEALSAVHRVLVVCQDSRVAAELRSAAKLEVLTVARYGTLDGFLGRSDVKLALYVSHLPRNFENLRFTSLLHAYIGHGDSDKGVSASNQLKAYDYVFAPGQAAVDRIARRLMLFDAAERCVIVGQPLTLAAPDESVPPAGRPVVLYAPTWEGAQPSVAYSSVLSHGERLVRALLADGRFDVLYRPHPLIGVTSRAYAWADHAIRAVSEAADGASAVVTADEEPLEASFARASVLVTDVSAVATAWLPSLKPLVVTRPSGPEAVAADSGMLTVVPRLDADDVEGAPHLLAAELADDSGRSRRQELVAYYLSPYWPDRVQERFVQACGEIIRLRDEQRARLVAEGATGI